MLVINFSHPITEQQRAQIEALTGQSIERLLEVKAQFDHAKSFVEQAKALVESVGLTSQEWQGAKILVNLPALASVAALVLADLHGRMGYFPVIARLAPVPDTLPPQFEVAEILNLQAARENGRTHR